MLRETNVTVAGNVTRTPEVKYRKVDGRPFTVVPIAVNNRRFDANAGQWVDDGVTYYDIICRGSLGANTLFSVDVGMPVVAHGRFRVHEWTTDAMKGARPCIFADSVGVDLSWGTTSYSKGSRTYPSTNEFDTSPPPASEGGPEITETDAPDYEADEVATLADEDGVVSDDNAEVILQRSA